MADTRYLKRRRQGWYFQLAVPSQLRRALGKATITASLKTRDLTVAQAGRWAKLIEAQEAFAKLSGRRPAAAQILDPNALLEIDEAARTHYRAALGKMHAEARHGLRQWDKAALLDAHTELFDAFCTGNFAPVAEPLAAYCEQEGLTPGTELYKALGNALVLAQMSAVLGRMAALEGQPSEEPNTFLEYILVDPVSLQPLRANSSRRGGLVFAEVAARFIAERQRDPAFALTAQTKGQYEAAFRLFDQWAKQPKLDDIDRRKASDFLDAIGSFDPHWGRGPGVKALSFDEIAKRFGGRERFLSAKTINRYAMALSMVWQHAEDRDGNQGANPWTRQRRPTAKRRGSSETDKRAFRRDEITKLLEHLPEIAPSEQDVASALPWLTLIGAYSGMRLNEICELDVEDVKETAGIWYFDLTASKTDAGVRFVPIHSKILEAGFPEYRHGVAKAALWPGLKPGGPDGKRSWYVSKRFTGYRRALGLVDIDKVTSRDRLDFHSLRRSAVTALKRAGIPEHEIAELVGHEHPHVTMGVYADRHLLDRLKTIVEAINYSR